MLQALVHVEVGRVELRERRGTLRLDPSHAGAELLDGIDGELHERKRRLRAALKARDVEGQQATRNLLHGAERKTAEVSGTNLREKAFHHESDGVVMCDDKQGTWRSTVLTDAHHWQPEEPGPQGPKSVELLGDGLRITDLASSLDEAGELRDEASLFLVLLQVGFNLGQLEKNALESIEILLAWLTRLVIRGRRRRSSWESTALSNEFAKLGLVLPRIHGLDNLHSWLESGNY